ncbi:MAG: transposase [Pseudomonadota bacterium]
MPCVDALGKIAPSRFSNTNIRWLATKQSTRPPLSSCRSRPPIVVGHIRARVESSARLRLDLSDLDERYRNDDTGAPAYPPTVLLKVILFAYSRGIIGSRPIARAGREHVTFIALCCDQAPHFTTSAGFIQATLAKGKR